MLPVSAGLVEAQADTQSSEHGVVATVEHDWYADAPSFFSSRKPDTASAAHAIQFSLSGPRSDAYRLRVSLLIEHSNRYMSLLRFHEAVAAERSHKKRDARIVRASLSRLIRIACS
jgi:hypothetical protein